MTSCLRLRHMELAISSLNKDPKLLPTALDFQVESVTVYAFSCPVSIAKRLGTRVRCRLQQPCPFLTVPVRHARSDEGPRLPE